MKRILSVSYDPALLASRERLLQILEVTVTSALELSSALKLCEQGGFDLLLLGHTVAPAAKADLIQTFRRTCKGSILAMHKSSEMPVSEADYNFESSGHPEELISFVARILHLDDPNSTFEDLAKPATRQTFRTLRKGNSARP